MPPWEWDARPFEKARVLCALRAVQGARTMLEQQNSIDVDQITVG